MRIDTYDMVSAAMNGVAMPAMEPLWEVLAKMRSAYFVAGFVEQATDPVYLAIAHDTNVASPITHEWKKVRRHLWFSGSTHGVIQWAKEQCDLRGILLTPTDVAGKTCPHCGHAVLQTMPLDGWQFGCCQCLTVFKLVLPALQKIDAYKVSKVTLQQWQEAKAFDLAKSFLSESLVPKVSYNLSGGKTVVTPHGTTVSDDKGQVVFQHGFLGDSKPEVVEAATVPASALVGMIVKNVDSCPHCTTGVVETTYLSHVHGDPYFEHECSDCHTKWTDGQLDVDPQNHIDQ